MEIAWHDAPRAELLALFREAEDSERELRSYVDAGRVLVARHRDVAIGHLQLVHIDDADQEIKNMAVAATWRGRGVGRSLVERAIEECTVAGAGRLMVATGAADVGNLRFYQRLGFRMLRIERDVFTPERGYPVTIVDGIRLLDQVWLSRELSPDATDAPTGG